MSPRRPPRPAAETGELTASLLDSLRVGVVGLDARDCVVLLNAEASRLLGFSAEHARGQPLPQLLAPAHPLLPLLAQLRGSGREVSALDCALLPDPSGTAWSGGGEPGWRASGEGRRADLYAAAWEAPDGSAGAALALFDRTSGHALEALVDQRVRDELFERLAQGIAHEIRNPLSGISGAAELLQRKLEAPELARYPALIRAEVDRICRLLDDLGQLTRGAALRLQRTNLHQVLDNLIELQRQSALWRGVEVRREYDPSIPELCADPDRLVQIFLNLLRNAVQAMKGEGRLTVTTRFESQFRFSEAAGAHSRMVRIDVEDTGPGLAEADLPHLFTPFFSKGEGGTGLGLAVAQHWALRHGGRILALQAPGKGARLRVLLPVGEGA
jgi:two-component system, NtrC family, nitrogen regulation sensor histidine kinase GlnL